MHESTTTPIGQPAHGSVTLEPAPSPLVHAPDRQRGWRRPGRERGPAGLVRALPARERVALVTIAGLWLASAVFFWQWWLEPAHQSTVAGLLVNSVVLAFDLVVVPLWFFFFLLRMRRPEPGARGAAAANRDHRHQGAVRAVGRSSAPR